MEMWPPPDISLLSRIWRAGKVWLYVRLTIGGWRCGYVIMACRALRIDRNVNGEIERLRAYCTAHWLDRRPGDGAGVGQRTRVQQAANAGLPLDTKDSD